jgi:hypothetical protein
MNMVHIWCMLVYMHCYFMGMNMIVFTFNFVIMCVYGDYHCDCAYVRELLLRDYGYAVVFNHCKICTNYHYYYSGNK